MSITVGEVNAVLSARDDMSATLKAAQQNVKDLETTFASFGTMSQASMQSAEKALAEARAEVDKIQASMHGAAGSVADLGTKTEALGTTTEDLRTKTDKTSSTMSDFAGMVDRVIERMLIYASVRGVVNAIEGTMAWGLELERLSVQTGLSVQAIQQLNFAAVETAVPLTTITQAISQMERKIDLEDTGLRQALKHLGLEFTAIRAMSPEAAFEAITSKMKDVTDQFTFAGEAAEIFNSRSGSNIAAVIKQWDDLKAKALESNTIISEDEQKVLAELGKGWEVLKLKAEAYFAAVIVGSARTVQELAGKRPASGVYPVTGFESGTEESATFAGPTTDAQDFAAMAAKLKSPAGFSALAKPAPFAEGPSLSGGGKIAQDQLEAIRAQEKEITDQVHMRIDAEKALAAFEAITNKDRLKQLSDEYTANTKIEDAINKANNVAEESARANVLGRFGQKINPNTGEPMRPGEEDPSYQLQQTLDRLQNAQSSQFGPDRDRSTAFQQQDAIDKYLQSQYEEAVAVDKATNALSNQAAAVAAVNKAHIALTPSLASVAQGFEGISLQIAASAEQMQQYYAALALTPNVGGSAQPVRSGAGFQNLAQDALTNQNILNGSGGLNVTVQGNVYTMDPSGKAAFAQLVNDAISPTLQAGRKLGSA